VNAKVLLVNETPRTSFAAHKTAPDESREPNNLAVPTESRISGPRSTIKTEAKSIRIRHILAPTDLSKGSRGSVSYAMWLAVRYQARLTLLYIFRMSENSESESAPLESEEIEQRRDRAEQRLLKFYDVIRAQYSNTEVLFRTGDPDTDIAQIAAFLGVDLVVC
jgi:universal stress protein A